MCHCSVLVTDLEVGSLGEEVLQQHQHVRGHRGYVGGEGVGPVCVAEARPHRVIHK